MKRVTYKVFPNWMVKYVR